MHEFLVHIDLECMGIYIPVWLHEVLLLGSSRSTFANERVSGRPGLYLGSAYLCFARDDFARAVAEHASLNTSRRRWDYLGYSLYGAVKQGRSLMLRRTVGDFAGLHICFRQQASSKVNLAGNLSQEQEGYKRSQDGSPRHSLCSSPLVRSW